MQLRRPQLSPHGSDPDFAGRVSGEYRTRRGFVGEVFPDMGYPELGGGAGFRR